MNSSTAFNTPTAETSTEKLKNQLNVLSIFYFIWAGLTMVGALAGLLEMGVGLFGLANPLIIVQAVQNNPNAAITGAAFFAWFFIICGLLIMLFSAVLGWVYWQTAMNLRKQQGYTFCLVVACIMLIGIPLGTILGIVSLIYLFKDETKVLFGKAPKVVNAPAQASPSGPVAGFTGFNLPKQ